MGEDERDYNLHMGINKMRRLAISSRTTPSRGGAISGRNPGSGQAVGEYHIYSNQSE